MEKTKETPEIIDPERVEILSEEQSLLLDDNFLRLALERARRYDALLVYSISQLTTADVVSIGKRPYIGASGAEKIARRFGIGWRGLTFQREERTDEKGTYYVYTYKGTFCLPGGLQEIEAIGTCTSRSKFFGTKTEYDEEGHETLVLRPLSEIDEEDIKKTCLTNCRGNGVRQLIGLNGLTWEYLAKCGFSKENFQHVGFKGGAKEEMGQEEKDKREGIRTMILEMEAGDVNAAAGLLVKITTWRNKEGKLIPGKNDPYKISDAALNPSYANVKKAYAEWKKKQASPSSSPSNGAGFQGQPTAQDDQGALNL